MSALRHALARLLAGTAALTIASIPISAAAASVPSVDSLWNQADGISIDSPLYVFQAWWDGWNRTVPNNPVERGISELSQANADLLNAYTLLQKEHSNAGPQPVPIIDPLLSSAYDAITGSNSRAPLGSLGSAISRSILQLEGRDSTDDLVRALLQDYRAKQAVAVRDLKAEAAYAALLTANAQREADFLTRVEAVTAPQDGVDTLLAEADRQTTTLAGTAIDHTALSKGAGTGKSGAPGQPAGHGSGQSGAQGQGAGHGKGKGPAQPESPQRRH